MSTPGASAGRRWFAAYLVVVGLLVAVLAALPTGVPRDVVYVVVSGSTVLAILAGVWLHRPAPALPWLVMAAGQSLWFVADALLYWRLDALGIDRFPDVPDAFYLAGYVVLAGSLHLLVRARRVSRDLPGLLDSLTVSTGLALLSWVFLAQPILQRSEQSSAATAVSVAYVLADIVLIGGLVRLMLIPSSASAPLRLLLVALALLIAADALSATLDDYTYALHPMIETLWPTSYLAWGAAALHPAMARITDAAPTPRRRMRARRVGAMTLATLVTPAVLTFQQLTGAPLSVWTVVFGSAAMFLLVLGRMQLALIEVARISRQRAELQDELRYQAEHDPLTGLPNRSRTMHLVDQVVSATAAGTWTAVLFVDLDGFKAVNDTYGHRCGDEVLRAVAGRLQEVIRGDDAATRLGGDEFVVLLDAVPDERTAVQVAERIITSVSEPVPLGEHHQVHVGASVGIALGRRGITADALLHQADVALYRAKAAGRGRIVVFGRGRSEDFPVGADTGLALVLGEPA